MYSMCFVSCCVSIFWKQIDYLKIFEIIEHCISFCYLVLFQLSAMLKLFQNDIIRFNVAVFSCLYVSVACCLELMLLVVKQCVLLGLTE